MNIDIRPLEIKYIDTLAELALDNYLLEKKQVNALKSKDKDYFLSKLQITFPDSIGNIAFENNNIVGYLAYHTNVEHQYANLPLYGYGIRHAKRGEIMDRLFQNTATSLGEIFCKNLRVNIYAHDIEVLKFHVLSAFTMDTTDVIRDTEALVNARNVDYIFKEINKTELLNFKDDVIEFYRDLINHLRASPIFYPCYEFLPIEERFNDFLSDSIRIFIILDKSKLVGMLISEPSDIEIAQGDDRAMSLSDLFVAKEYRGKGIATCLLRFVNNELKKSGARRLYVTHGTINPTSRGFWDKYFANFSFAMSRQINPDMLGIIEKI